MTKTDTIAEYNIDWATYIDPLFSFPSPIELPIRVFVAAPNPTPIAIIIKYIGKDFAKALRASGEILPAKKVSTKF